MKRIKYDLQNKNKKLGMKCVYLKLRIFTIQQNLACLFFRRKITTKTCTDENLISETCINENFILTLVTYKTDMEYID